MEYWVIGLIALPILYATGSLRRAAGLCGISGRVFIIYFAAALGLAALRTVYISDIGVKISGAFMCLAACVYAAVKRKFDYRFFIAAAAALLIGTGEFVVSNSFVLPYIGYVRTALIALTAVAVYRARAALFVPAMALVYNAAVFAVSLILGLSHNYTVFADMELIVFGIAFCLLCSYAFERKHGAHARRSHA